MQDCLDFVSDGWTLAGQAIASVPALAPGAEFQHRVVLALHSPGLYSLACTLSPPAVPTLVWSQPVVRAQLVLSCA